MAVDPCTLALYPVFKLPLDLTFRSPVVPSYCKQTQYVMFHTCNRYFLKGYTVRCSSCYHSRRSSAVVVSYIHSNVTTTHSHDTMLLLPSSYSHQSHTKHRHHCNYRAAKAALITLLSPSSSSSDHILCVCASPALPKGNLVMYAPHTSISSLEIWT